MSIIKTITNDYEFAEWLKQSDSYNHNFSFEGANALQAYLDKFSEETESPIEFDPIAWCVEYSEYNNAQEAYEEYQGDNADTYNEAQALEWLQDNTFVIKLDNGGVIIQDF